MIFAIVEAESGRLVSYTAEAAKVADAKTLEARGYVVVERPDGEQDGAWNPAIKRWDAKPAEPAPDDALSRLEARIARIEAAIEARAEAVRTR